MTAEAYLSKAYSYMQSVYYLYSQCEYNDSRLFHTSYTGLIFFGIFIYLLPLSLKTSGALYVRIFSIFYFIQFACLGGRKR